jgi:hypothetical protein
VDHALAATAGRAAARRIARTMISVSIGLKHQAASRDFSRERMGIAVDLLVR